MENLNDLLDEIVNALANKRLAEKMKQTRGGDVEVEITSDLISRVKAAQQQIANK